MSPVFGVVIAGGVGSRLGGVRKADLRVGSVRLLDRAVAGLWGVQAPIMVAHGPGAPLEGLPGTCVGVADLAATHGGPLAGIAAAVHALDAQGVRRGVLVSVAVDTPFVPADFMARMVAAVEQGDAAYAGWGKAFYPTNAAWRIEAIADLPDRLGGPGAVASPKALQRELGARQVDWDAAEDPFANVNTVADLLAVQKRLRG